MHWGLQTLAKLVPAHRPSGKGGQAGVKSNQPLQRQINFHCQQPQVMLCGLEKFLNKACACVGGCLIPACSCPLCNQAPLQRSWAVASPLTAPSPSFPWQWACRAGAHHVALARQNALQKVLLEKAMSLETLTSKFQCI